MIFVKADEVGIYSPKNLPKDRQIQILKDRLPNDRMSCVALEII